MDGDGAPPRDPIPGLGTRGRGAVFGDLPAHMSGMPQGRDEMMRHIGKTRPIPHAMLITVLRTLESFVRTFQGGSTLMRGSRLR